MVKHSARTKVKAFLDIIADHLMEQLIDFPTRGDNTLDLVLSTMPGQIHQQEEITP